MRTVGAMRHTYSRHAMVAPRWGVSGRHGPAACPSWGKTRSRLMRHWRHGAPELRETGPDRARAAVGGWLAGVENAAALRVSLRRRLPFRGAPRGSYVADAGPMQG